MVQIIGQEGLGDILGQQVGSGMSSGFQMLLESKLKSMQKQQELKNIQNMFAGQKSQTAESNYNNLPESTDTETIKIENRFSSPLDEMTDAQKAAYANTYPDIYKSLVEDKKFKDKDRRFWEEGARQRNKLFFERLDKIEDSLPEEKQALQTMRAAIDSGDFTGFGNKLAEITGQDIFKTSSGAAFQSAAKTFLIKEISQVTGPKNQFLEKNVLKGLGSSLYNPIANDIIQSAKEYAHDLKEKEIEISRSLEDQYVSKGMEPPRNFKSLVRRELKPFEQQLNDQYQKKLDILAKNKGLPPLSGKEQTVVSETVMMIDPSGNLRKVPKNQAKEASQAGYKLQR